MFRRAGVEPPKNWDELKRIAGRLSAAGVVPFSVAGADGWTLTDWFENVYLRTAGPRRYDELAEHKLSWTDRSVKQSLARLSQIFGNPHWLAGRSSGALDTSFEDSVHNVFGEHPRAAMVYEGDFVASELANDTNDTKPTLGQDFDLFDFPAIGRSESAAVIGGDVAALFTDNEAAKSLVRYLATPEGAQPWASAGGFVSPNKNLDPDAYTDAVNRRSARALQEAKTIRFDLSDQQPPAFGATDGQGMWQVLRDYLRRPGDVDAITRRLDEAATAAEKCERAVGGEC
jgi:ABC-type glycerol-3-phosphate transport system substrate-binding protein